MTLPTTDFLEIHTDGASRGNPGESGAGATLRARDGTLVREVLRYLGRKTNNEAEYQALILALEEAARLGAREILVRADSKLVIEQMRGVWKVKMPHLKPLHARARRLVREFEKVRFEHVRREFNADADALANRAIDEKIVDEESPVI